MKNSYALKILSFVRLLYWWVKMIDCLLTDLSTADILKVYIVIRIIQRPLFIKMRAILIYSYCMWNAHSIRSIKWFRRRSFQKQARTMTNNAFNRANMIIISSFESIRSLIIRSVWERFIVSDVWSPNQIEWMGHLIWPWILSLQYVNMSV
jgi:hypothetical protein